MREVLETVLLTVMIFLAVQAVIRNFRVEGHSMNPNLQTGQYLVIDRISYQFFSNPARGDVIVFNAPNRTDRDYVKRIIGLPGETIELRAGQVYINNELYPEEYGVFLDQSSLPPETVPVEHVFVLGDNRGNSNDSRHWGLLPQENIVGRAWLSYWPPETWGLIPNDGPTDAAQLFNLFK